MPHATWIPEGHCAVAQSLAVLGDAWDVLVIRDLARGHHRFEQLAAELGISRKVLTQRLRKLETHGLLERIAYQESPRRHDYRLTPRGSALIPVLVALQDWGDQWLLGDGAATGLGARSCEQRVSSLIGTRIPHIPLQSTSDQPCDVVATGRKSVLFAFPMASGQAKPVGWEAIPGAVGCTLENRLFRDRYPEFQRVGAGLRGVSTQRPDEQRAFSQSEGVPFPLLSDADLHLTAALRLPTFRAGDVPRLRRLILITDADRTIIDALFPVTDIPAAVAWALARVS